MAHFRLSVGLLPGSAYIVWHFPKPSETPHVREAVGSSPSRTLTVTHLGRAEQQSFLFHCRPWSKYTSSVTETLPTMNCCYFIGRSLTSRPCEGCFLRAQRFSLSETLLPSIRKGLLKPKPAVSLGQWTSLTRRTICKTWDLKRFTLRIEQFCCAVVTYFSR